MSKLDTELFQVETIPLGADAIDFVTSDATYIRLQVLVRGRIKVIPNDLIENIAKLVREYDLGKEQND